MRIRRYIAQDILVNAAAVCTVLFLVVFSSRFMGYLGQAAVGNLPADVLLPVMLFKLPSFFELILPLGFFIGTLLAIGRLYTDSEMVVLRACGVGPRQLAGFVIIPALIASSLVAALTLLVSPLGAERAQILLDSPRSVEGLQVMTPGRFRKQRDGDYVTYAESMDESGVMENVFVVERQSSDRGDRLTITYAETGAVRLDESSGMRYFELRNGQRFRGLPGTPQFEAAQFSRYGELIPEQVSFSGASRLSAIHTEDLWRSEDPKARAELYWRISLPTLLPIVALIALALSRTDARRGRFARLGMALAIFLFYFIALTQARTAVEDGAGMTAFVGVHVFFALLALVQLNWEWLSLRRLGKTA